MNQDLLFIIPAVILNTGVLFELILLNKVPNIRDHKIVIGIFILSVLFLAIRAYIMDLASLREIAVTIMITMASLTIIPLMLVSILIPAYWYFNDKEKLIKWLKGDF